jgi:hypothetical protein
MCLSDWILPFNLIVIIVHFLDIHILLSDAVNMTLFLRTASLWQILKTLSVVKFPPVSQDPTDSPPPHLDPMDPQSLLSSSPMSQWASSQDMPALHLQPLPPQSQWVEQLPNPCQLLHQKVKVRLWLMSEITEIKLWLMSELTEIQLTHSNS